MLPSNIVFKSDLAQCVLMQKTLTSNKVILFWHIFWLSDLPNLWNAFFMTVKMHHSNPSRGLLWYRSGPQLQPWGSMVSSYEMLAFCIPISSPLKENMTSHKFGIMTFFVVLSSRHHCYLHSWNPLLSTKWVQSQYCPKLSSKEKKILVEPGFKPGAAGWEARMLTLCYAEVCQTLK